VAVRGAEQREAIRAVLHVFAAEADKLVFAGSCVLALYARPTGHALTTTKGVDCVFTGDWTEALQLIAERVAPGGPLRATDLACRYELSDAKVFVDILDHEGRHVPGSMRWLAEAAARAERFALDASTSVRAISPAYFLLTKLDALADRGTGPEAKDLEDIVTLAVEVSDLGERVRACGRERCVRELWLRAAARLRFTGADVPELVAMHLGQEDAPECGRVERVLAELLVG
jgi:hypothetical protein